MTDSIPGLLEKLRELDPETYDLLEKIDSNVIIYEPWTAKIFDYILQGVVQDAIAARGWYSRVGPMTNIRVAQRDAPANALLEAYVAALEAEATR